MALNILSDIVESLQKLDRRVRRLERIDIGAGGGVGTLTWTNWSPTITQGGSVSASVNFAKYAIDGKVAHVEGRVLITSAGSANNAVIIGNVPSSIQPANNGDDTYKIGGGLVKDTLTAYYQGALVAVGATDWRIIQGGQGNYVGITPNFALANGDEITFDGKYEIS